MGKPFTGVPLSLVSGMALDNSEEIKTVAKVLSWAEGALVDAAIPDAKRETLFIASALLGCKPLEVFMKRSEEVGDEFISRFEEAVRRRGKREPGQYISGVQEFYGLEFKVGPGVLIPRPETEGLIDLVLNSPLSAGKPLILDLGTGSGCIAATLAHELPGARVVATDISEAALATAMENAIKNGVRDRVDFIRSDLFDGLGHHGAGFDFDIIVSNPPYVTVSEFNALEPEVRVHEPSVALIGGEDGFDFYRRIANDAPLYLKPGGLLALEAGYGQTEEITSLLKAGGAFASTGVVYDLYGVERIVWAVKG